MVKLFPKKYQDKEKIYSALQQLMREGFIKKDEKQSYSLQENSG
jgi:DNA-binding IclR family transcriptional regulator